jgi:site-specific DNA recombinase
MNDSRPKTQRESAPYGENGLDFSAKESVNDSDSEIGESQMTQAQQTYSPPKLDVLAEAMTPKVAVSYLRVSTRDQAFRGEGDNEGFSIPAQREANRYKALSMGALVVKEFVDRGASARSANRPELQLMLEYLTEHDVDYVIVHKLDRLARNRSDDVEISKSLEASNVRLVSTTESIDQTPSGMLLHGIMSSIAEFYSRNLAAEVMKGMTQKARSGGTVGRAPIGYRNFRTTDGEGRESRTVVIDDERAPMIKRAFELYATGDWTISNLVDYLNERGLTTVSTPKLASKPILEGLLHKVLINPYYKGQTRFQGVEYEGRHEALVDDLTWQRVQDVLASHVNGERLRKHPHFLKSTVFCGQCGERLLVQHSTSGSGLVYPYFYCSGRQSKRTKCTQKAVLIYEVEQKLEDHYLQIQLEQSFRNSVEKMIREEFQKTKAQNEGELQILKREREKLERQREKLMEAHYAGAIPVDLLGQEQERIGRALGQITSTLSATQTKFETVENNLQQALDLTVDCGVAYKNAPEHIKRMFNQAFFEKVLVVGVVENPGDVRVEAKLRPPFDVLLGSKLKSFEAEVREAQMTKKSSGKTAKGVIQKADSAFFWSNSFNKTLLVELRGFEPLTPCMPCRCATSCATAPM